MLRGGEERRGEIRARTARHISHHPGSLTRRKPTAISRPAGEAKRSRRTNNYRILLMAESISVEWIRTPTRGRRGGIIGAVPMTVAGNEHVEHRAQVAIEITRAREFNDLS